MFQRRGLPVSRHPWSNLTTARYRCACEISHEEFPHRSPHPDERPMVKGTLDLIFLGRHQRGQWPRLIATGDVQK
jgi:hypothetical protein